MNKHPLPLSDRERDLVASTYAERYAAWKRRLSRRAAVVIICLLAGACGLAYHLLTR